MSQPAPASNVPDSLLDRLRQSSHPVAIIFYIFFRLAPLFLYLFGSLVIADFSLVFILVAILLALDFWTVKNVSGRLMVGLRWWNETSEDGTSTWVYETASPDRYINPIDSKCFWLLMYAVPGAWAVLGLVAVLKFELIWLLGVIYALVLMGTNTLAYNRSDKFAKANTSSSNIVGRLFSGVTQIWGQNTATSMASRFWSS
ncbi:Golgi apparatus membrane protein TVP23 [Wickerhamiella sorbophila]|uniref:Golgi apparatus membrane protein TVP23 n=1 Tax=Wickerhamiella sorbophila TaxID=45607 RepID=A0A2T0FNM5_9ASCO|nr:Golgi apparatus membrane protein TVP23 [Wickerhamiella sorbophila]PRT56584.1 Golgi apparatus membrane protein TVP23 [Wickerhamiella sorbophila]